MIDDIEPIKEALKEIEEACSKGILGGLMICWTVRSGEAEATMASRYAAVSDDIEDKMLEQLKKHVRIRRERDAAEAESN